MTLRFNPQFPGDKGPRSTRTGRYVHHQARWRLDRLRSVWAKIQSFWRAVTRGRVSRAEGINRIKQCGACDKSIRKDGKLYCVPCGCGEWLLAQLDGPVPKVRWVAAKCPHPDGSKWEV